MIAASVSADNTHKPSVTDLEQRHCRLQMLSVHPDRQPSHNFPVEEYFLLTCCDVGQHLSALSLQSHSCVTHNFITVLHHRCSGEGHLSRRVLKVQTQSEFCSCFGESSSDLSNFYSRVLVITGRISVSFKAEFWRPKMNNSNSFRAFHHGTFVSQKVFFHSFILM